MIEISCWDSLGFCMDQPDGGTGQRQLGPSAIAMAPAHELYQELRKLKQELLVTFVPDENPLLEQSNRLATEEDGVKVGKSAIATVPPSYHTSFRTQNVSNSAAVKLAVSESPGVARSLTGTGRSKLGSRISSGGTGTCKVLGTRDVSRRQVKSACTMTPRLIAKTETAAAVGCISSSKSYAGTPTTPCSTRFKLMAAASAVDSSRATAQSLGDVARIARNVPAVKSCIGTGSTSRCMKASATPAAEAATPDVSMQKEQQQRSSVSVPSSMECKVASVQGPWSLLDTAASSSHIPATPPNIIPPGPTAHSVSAAASHSASFAPSPAPAQHWEVQTFLPAQQENLRLGALRVQGCIPDGPSSSSPPASDTAANAWMHVNVDSELETLMMTSDACTDSDEWIESSLPESKVWDRVHSAATIGCGSSCSSSRDMVLPFSFIEVSASTVAAEATCLTTEPSSAFINAAPGASTDAKPTGRGPAISDAVASTCQGQEKSYVSQGTPILAPASLPGAKTSTSCRLPSALSGYTTVAGKLSTPRVVRPRAMTLVEELKGPGSTVRVIHGSGIPNPAGTATATKSCLGNVAKAQCKSGSARSAVTAAMPSKSVQRQRLIVPRSPGTPNSNLLARKSTTGVLGTGKPTVHSRSSFPSPAVAQQHKCLTATPATPWIPADRTAKRSKPAEPPSCIAARSSAGPETLLTPVPDFLADMSLDDMLASDPALASAVQADVAAGVSEADVRVAPRRQRCVSDALPSLPLGIATANVWASDDWMKFDIDLELESLMPGGEGLDVWMEGQFGSGNEELWSLIAMEAELISLKYTEHT